MTSQPSAFSTPATPLSSSTWVGQPATFADSRRSPDVMMYGRQDFANRVGFWRMLEAIDRHDIRCTAVLNAEALAQNPSIRDAMVERRWAYLGHGINNTRFVHGMSGAEESAYYERMAQIVLDQTGTPLRGTGGPGPQACTENTVDIQARLVAGLYMAVTWTAPTFSAAPRVRWSERAITADAFWLCARVVAR